MGKYVQFNNTIGATTLTMHYATTNNGTFSLYKNGTHYMDISVASTGGWYTFADKVVTVSVAAGDTLKLQNDSGDVAINLDYMVLN